MQIFEENVEKTVLRSTRPTGSGGREARQRHKGQIESCLRQQYLGPRVDEVHSQSDGQFVGGLAEERDDRHGSGSGPQSLQVQAEILARQDRHHDHSSRLSAG